MTLKVGLIVGREWSFPPAFIEEVNRRDEGVVAEYVKLGAPAMDEPCEYAVIIDRISHEVPFYRTYLKQAALQGCHVVNNPFMWTADDKFFDAALATSLGVAHPKTVVLPNKEYIPGIVHDESLRNLKYPLDWQGIVDYIGLPCILKDAHGGGWKEVYVCKSLEELIYYYDQSGLLTMIVQEFIQWDQFIRCIALGQENVLPMKYDPRERKYHVEHEHLTPELGRRIVDDSLTLMRALGYDMCSLEWAVKDGVPYAIDFMNPAPDMDLYSLTPHYFEWAVKSMADMAIRLARNPRSQARDLRWDGFFAGSRVRGDGGGGTIGSGGRTLQGGGGGGHTGEGPALSGLETNTTLPTEPGQEPTEGGPGLLSGGRGGQNGGGTGGPGPTQETGNGPGQGSRGGQGGVIGSGTNQEPGSDGGAGSGSGDGNAGGDAQTFADAAHAVPSEPARGGTARSGEDTSEENAARSTEETA